MVDLNATSAASKAALEAIRHWSNQSELVKYAINGHGYMNTDGYFGITYPSDLDASEIANRENIPEGYVEATAWFGESSGDTHLLPLNEYHALLAQYFIQNNRHDLAEALKPIL